MKTAAVIALLGLSTAFAANCTVDFNVTNSDHSEWMATLVDGASHNITCMNEGGTGLTGYTRDTTVANDLTCNNGTITNSAKCNQGCAENGTVWVNDASGVFDASGLNEDMATFAAGAHGATMGATCDCPANACTAPMDTGDVTCTDGDWLAPDGFTCNRNCKNVITAALPTGADGNTLANCNDTDADGVAGNGTVCPFACSDGWTASASEFWCTDGSVATLSAITCNADCTTNVTISLNGAAATSSGLGDGTSGADGTVTAACPQGSSAANTGGDVATCKSGNWSVGGSDATDGSDSVMCYDECPTIGAAGATENLTTTASGGACTSNHQDKCEVQCLTDGMTDDGEKPTDIGDESAANSPQNITCTQGVWGTKGTDGCRINTCDANERVVAHLCVACADVRVAPTPNPYGRTSDAGADPTAGDADTCSYQQVRPDLVLASATPNYCGASCEVCKRGAEGSRPCTKCSTDFVVDLAGSNDTTADCAGDCVPAAGAVGPADPGTNCAANNYDQYIGSPGTADPAGFEITCGRNWHMVSGACVQCAAGLVRPAGDHDAAVNTTCAPQAACVAGEHVVATGDDTDMYNGWMCEACPAGSSPNATQTVAGTTTPDIAMATDCDANAICVADETVAGNACVACNSGYYFALPATPLDTTMANTSDAQGYPNQRGCAPVDCAANQWAPDGECIWCPQNTDYVIDAAATPPQLAIKSNDPTTNCDPCADLFWSGDMSTHTDGIIQGAAQAPAMFPCTPCPPDLRCEGVSGCVDKVTRPEGSPEAFSSIFMCQCIGEQAPWGIGGTGDADGNLWHDSDDNPQTLTCALTDGAGSIVISFAAIALTALATLLI